MSELSVFESAKQDYEKELEELRDNFNYEKDLRIKSEKELNKYKKVINKIKEELTGDFDFEVYICNDNKGNGKTMKLGASIYRHIILEKLNELLKEIK